MVPPIPRKDLNFIPARRPVPFAQDSAEPVLPLCNRTSGSHRPRGRLSSQPSGKRTRCRLWPVAACNLGSELTSCAGRLGNYSPTLQIGKETTRPGMHSARASSGVENLKFDFLLLPGLGTNLLPVLLSPPPEQRLLGLVAGYLVLHLFPSKHRRVGGCWCFWSRG